MDKKLKDDRWCFACGTENPHGLRLADIRLENQECVCSFIPHRWHQGWVDILHGGITATLLDEVMTHLVYRLGYDAVTAEMRLRLRLPVPIGERLQARAGLTRLRGKFAQTHGALTLSDGQTAAEATAKFIIEPRGPDTPHSPILTLAARQAVIFDLFGTLVSGATVEQYQEFLQETARLIGMDAQAFERAFEATRSKRFTGRYTRVRNNIAEIAQQAKVVVSDEQLDRVEQMRLASTRRALAEPYPDVLPALEALRSAGRPIGLISDCSPEVVQLWPECPLSQFIPEPVLSAAVGLHKPDERIYRAALQRMGVGPYRAVYVGDGDSQELPGARRVGLCPILVDRGESRAMRLNPARECDTIVHDLTQLLPLIGLSKDA